MPETMRTIASSNTSSIYFIIPTRNQPVEFDPAIIAVQFFCLIFSLCVHEAAHAAMANQCGDPTARLLGRLTLNPVKHADPIGTVILPLLMMITQAPVLFGWAKPVPFNPLNLRNRERDSVFIALAGPASNLLMAFLFTLMLRIVVIASGIDNPDEFTASPLFLIALYMILINLALMLFNCIPLPPLDGHYVLGYFLPPAGQEKLRQIGPFGIIIAIVLGRHIIAVPFRWMMDIALSYALLGPMGVVEYFTG